MAYQGANSQNGFQESLLRHYVAYELEGLLATTDEFLLQEFEWTTEKKREYQARARLHVSKIYQQVNIFQFIGPAANHAERISLVKHCWRELRNINHFLQNTIITLYNSKRFPASESLDEFSDDLESKSSQLRLRLEALVLAAVDESNIPVQKGKPDARQKQVRFRKKSRTK